MVAVLQRCRKVDSWFDSAVASHVTIFVAHIVFFIDVDVPSFLLCSSSTPSLSSTSTSHHFTSSSSSELSLRCVRQLIYAIDAYFVVRAGLVVNASGEVCGVAVYKAYDVVMLCCVDGVGVFWEIIELGVATLTIYSEWRGCGKTFVETTTLYTQKSGVLSLSTRRSSVG